MVRRIFAFILIAVLAALAGCSSGGSQQGAASSASASGAASSASGSDGAEAYRLVVEELSESDAYRDFEAAVLAFLDDDPVGRCASGDFASLEKDAAKLKALAAKLPSYDGDNATAILAYQHMDRFAQSAVSSAEAFASAKTVSDVEGAEALFGAAYDEMKALSKTVIQLREERK